MVDLKQINTMQGVDIATVDKSQLTDVSGINFDNSLPQGERAVHILNQVKNPYCFRYGDTAVKVEFPEDAPPLQEVITNFLIRQKSGL
ncbi:hypothetical protein I6U48_24710 [Clostridium sp. PL3]|uniref:DUF6870 domain-containing protein n=1 Tax=Clostridium thailandense TaxID=2794346 RepID=A0A949X5R9_9CLOT|nr:hypothetical protein [Clostridium thailandense]MBV7276093.1 hypothetical protein [Clostridium thailandense]